VSEEIVCGLRDGNDFPTLSYLLDKPLIQFSVVYKYIENVTLKQYFIQELTLY